MSIKKVLQRGKISDRMPESKLLREEWTDELAEEALMAFGILQEDILLIIAERLEIISQLSPEEIASMTSAAATAKYLNEDIARIRKAIKDNDRKYAPQITKIFHEVEEENYKFAKKYFDYRKIPISKVRQNTQMREMIEAMHKQTVNGLLNLSHTYAYDYDGVVQPIGKAYRRIVNKAVLGIATGTTSYQKEMRKAINQLTESGIKTLVWDGENRKRVVRRADGHIRMNIMEGVRQLNAELQDENGKSFGADGVEISMHHLCAPDHLHIQGQQFKKSDWMRINNRLQRPIGTLNCQHWASPIIIGVSVSVYTDAERKEAIENSNKIVEYNREKMTRYEASQEMRKKERNIRKWRSRKKAFETAGDSVSAKKADNKIKSHMKEYKSFCKDVGLSERMERTRYYV